MKPHKIKSKLLCHFSLLSILIFTPNCSNQSKPGLTTEFSGKYGQIEIGGKFAGLEFHHSRPLPSRISFYYPVANSIDISEGYWIRDRSTLFNVIVNTTQKSDTFKNAALSYKYTPYQVTFEERKENYNIRFEYNVCEDLPVIVMKITLENMHDADINLNISTSINTSLKTSHSYTNSLPTKIQYEDNRSIATALYPYVETDSTCLFVTNAGIGPISDKSVNTRDNVDPVIKFNYEESLSDGVKKEIIYLVGICKIDEYEDIIIKASEQWLESIQKNHSRIKDYAYNQTYFKVNDQPLQQTMHWSKALIASNIHYLDGKFIPMPCPAEYNFFFTHDLLLTSLGTVYYDTEYVRKGLLYLNSLTNKENVLPHAYYWKDNQYITEFCNSSNWNHLWLIIIASTYLKHSNDQETIQDIFPMLKNSIQLMLTNKKSNDLMYARYPDWWDIGNVYGARSYITILMYKALQDYVFLSFRVKKDIHLLSEYLELAEKMKKSLVEKLWNEEKGYLFNMIDDKIYDWHYYTGSIVATHYDLIDQNQKVRLLSTVKEKLLDKNLGVRNVMPADFHLLTDVYNFKGMEAGLQYFYINGGVWSHNNIWYIIGLILNNQSNEAKINLKKYMTLDGIKNSPNGIPAFYEYRISDKSSLRYGEIDKPSFLWAGGLYISALYQLVGVRENSYNIYFNPKLPDGMNHLEYDLKLLGQLCRVKWIGSGEYFRKITIDGNDIASAVQFKPAKNINLERGLPSYPYLANCNVEISNVFFSKKEKILKIDFEGIPEQKIVFKIISPLKLIQFNFKSDSIKSSIMQTETKGIISYAISAMLENKSGELILSFN